LSIAEIFGVSEGDTIADAWLTAVNLLDMVEHANKAEIPYDFAQARDKITKVYALAEEHALDKGNCACGLSEAEHAILKRKVITFFMLQVSNLKRFIV
jgi:2C-methyl-D-erythritol 2,4-cyclodiphosphate synthase